MFKAEEFISNSADAMVIAMLVLETKKKHIKQGKLTVNSFDYISDQLHLQSILSRHYLQRRKPEFLDIVLH